MGQKWGGWVQSWVGGSCPKYPPPSYKRSLTSTYLNKRVHIKRRGCPTLWGCSMVCIGKNIANYSKNPQFLPVICAPCTRCAYTPPRKMGKQI